MNTRFVGMRNMMEKNKQKRGIVAPLLLCCAALNIAQGFPTQGSDVRYTDYSSPGAHQLASWLTSQLRSKDFVAPVDGPVVPYRLPLQGKRNSELANAVVVGVDYPRDMYREGRK